VEQVRDDAVRKCEEGTRWKRRVNQNKRRVKQAKESKAEAAMGSKQRGRGKTHDWALDLEPLALPPDLPPVIFAGLVEVVKLGG
jgi:hypothetical protein